MNPTDAIVNFADRLRVKSPETLAGDMGQAEEGEGVTAEIIQADCLDAMNDMDEASVDAIVTDPPYGLKFMGAGWDHGVPDVSYWAAALRVAKPGAHLLAFGGTRLFHRLTVAIEDAGWEVRDCLMWLYGSGFPKSLAVDKAIDRQRHDTEQVYRVTAWIRAERDRAGLGNKDIDAAFGFCGMAGHWTSSKSQPAIPTLDQIPTLLGVLGLTLDDVPEDIRELIWTLNGPKGQPGEAWFRREVTGEAYSVPVGHSFAGDRYTDRAGEKPYSDTAPATDAAKQWHGWGTALKPAWEPVILARKPLDGTVAGNVLKHGCGAINVDGCRVGAGRWPANLILDEDAGAMLDEQATGGPSRFFYCPKASKSDRDDDNRHPTVKPTDLMAYLCRLVTPPGGTVLDPFCGSGSTGKAAVREGFNFIGIEREAEYAEIARQRVSAAEPAAPLLNGATA